MPAQAFDGSIWVAGGQIAGLVGGTVALVGVGTFIAARGIAQNQRLAPPPDFNPGRRRQRLVQQKDLRKEEQQPQTIDAEELEDVIAGKDAEEAKIKEDMKDVSSKPRG